MPYAKGQSGNPKGRPKLTAEQKSQKEQFQRLLKSSTVEALQSIWLRLFFILLLY